MATIDWLDVSSLSGSSGETIVSATPTFNTTMSARTITLKASTGLNGKEELITITQEAPAEGDVLIYSGGINYYPERFTPNPIYNDIYEEKIYFPEPLKVIDYDAIDGTLLYSVKVPEYTEYIMGNTVYDAPRLDYIELSSGVTFIGDDFLTQSNFYHTFVHIKFNGSLLQYSTIQKSDRMAPHWIGSSQSDGFIDRIGIIEAVDKTYCNLRNFAGYEVFDNNLISGVTNSLGSEAIGYVGNTSGFTFEDYDGLTYIKSSDGVLPPTVTNCPNITKISVLDTIENIASGNNSTVGTIVRSNRNWLGQREDNLQSVEYYDCTVFRSSSIYGIQVVLPELINSFDYTGGIINSVPGIKVYAWINGNKSDVTNSCTVSVNKVVLPSVRPQTTYDCVLVEVTYGGKTVSVYGDYSVSGVPEDNVIDYGGELTPNTLTGYGQSSIIGNSEVYRRLVFDNEITALPAGCFSGNTNLTQIVIPNTIQTIGENVFNGCDSLRFIDFKGTKNEWNSIQLNANWKNGSSLLAVNCTDGDIILFENNKIVYVADSAITAYRAYDFTPTITGHTFSNGVGVFSTNGDFTEFGSDCFHHMSGISGITKIYVPNSVTTVGFAAFTKCYNLENIDLSNVIQMDQPFYNGTKIKRVTIGSGATSNMTYLAYGNFYLLDIYYGGTMAQWNSLIDNTITYTGNRYIHCTDGTIDTNITTFKYDYTTIGWYPSSAFTSSTMIHKIEDRQILQRTICVFSGTNISLSGFNNYQVSTGRTPAIIEVGDGITSLGFKGSYKYDITYDGTKEQWNNVTKRPAYGCVKTKDGYLLKAPYTQ